MLQTDAFYPYSTFDTTQAIKQYKITPADVLEFRILSNDASVLIGAGTNNNNTGGGVNYSVRVEADGFVKLPALGRVYIQGLTFRQAELFLEEKYSEFLNKPFVTLNITNRRVFFFMGSLASVVTLKYENTTLFEALATVGSISENAKVYRIKLIRGNLKNPKVYIIDLSYLKGIENSDLVLQGNDIIYIETRRDLINKSLQLLTPYFSLISTILLTITLIKTLGK
jgi:polysaccharide export outer membrane protein